MSPVEFIVSSDGDNVGSHDAVGFAVGFEVGVIDGFCVGVIDGLIVLFIFHFGSKLMKVKYQEQFTLK